MVWGYALSLYLGAVLTVIFYFIAEKIINATTWGQRQSDSMRKWSGVGLAAGVIIIIGLVVGLSGNLVHAARN